MIEKYQLKALHVFQVRTLQTLRFGTRVALSNKSHHKPSLGTDYRIDLTVYSPDGTNSTFHEGIAFLPIDEVVQLDCSKWQTSEGDDQVMIFHLMPERLFPRMNGQGELELGRAEIWSLFTAQDHYVEYYRQDGFASGVLYQSGAFNYRKFSREATTVIQAPKVFLSSTLDTVLSILHTAFEPGYKQDAVLHCSLLNDDGHPVVKWVNRVKPFTAQSISIKEQLAACGTAISDESNEVRAYTLLGLCENAALLPLILNVDEKAGTLAVEHSLPPLYYGQSVTGPVRAQMISDLRNSGIFLTQGT